MLNMLKRLFFDPNKTPVEEARDKAINAAAWYIQEAYGEPTTPEQKKRLNAKLLEVAELFNAMYLEGQQQQAKEGDSGYETSRDGKVYWVKRAGKMGEATERITLKVNIIKAEALEDMAERLEDGEDAGLSDGVCYAAEEMRKVAAELRRQAKEDS